MGYSGSLIAACMGLISLRVTLQRNGTIKPNSLYLAITFVAASALIFPLLSFGQTGAYTLLLLTVTILFPYKQSLIYLLERTTRTGVKKLAHNINGKYLYNKHTGFFTLTHTQAKHKLKLWVGNVLNQIGSMDKQVNIKSHYYMLAFVIRLSEKSNFNCSILKGWPSPRFHNSEYRVRSRLIKGCYSISTDDISKSNERLTGGNSQQLQDCIIPKANNDHDQYALFSRVMNNNNDIFESIFSGELYDQLLDCASHSPYYEVNITPTSINIYTTLCNYEVQKVNMNFLLLLIDAVNDINNTSYSITNEVLCTQDEAA
ncbi:hypothetical protein MNBD_GAMMA12-402 [hydrothermal vent metagenome]|uniref:Uncharacterized protein n=1 Tax=hydrothermal vent metagenome TaxID=652676 RepID=A0A3B0YE23_9ZZZZ